MKHSLTLLFGVLFFCTSNLKLSAQDQAIFDVWQNQIYSPKFCDSVVYRTWNGSQWSFGGAGKQHIGPDGRMELYKIYDSLSNQNLCFKLIYNSHRKLIEFQTFFYIGSTFLKYSYTQADTNQNGRIIREHLYTFNGMTYDETSRNIYSYSAKGKMVGNHQLSFDNQTNTFFDNQIDSITYGTNGLKICDSNYYYDWSQQKLILGARTSFYYDAAGRDTFSLYELMDPNTSKFQPQSSTSMTYISDGHYVTINKSFNNSWLKVSMDSTNLDADGNGTITFYEWDDVFNKWSLNRQHINNCVMTGILVSKPSIENGFIYPNPSVGNIQVKSKGHLIISDMQGKLVYQTMITENNQTVQLQHLVPNLYTVMLITPQGIQTGKLVISR